MHTHLAHFVRYLVSLSRAHLAKSAFAIYDIYSAAAAAAARAAALEEIIPRSAALHIAKLAAHYTYISMSLRELLLLADWPPPSPV